MILKLATITDCLWGEFSFVWGRVYKNMHFERLEVRSWEMSEF